MTIPSPRPAALVEAMAEAALDALAVQCRLWLADPLDESMQQGIRDALDAAQTAGFVLVPRAELEEAAGALEQAGIVGHGPIANRLRQRSRG